MGLPWKIGLMGAGRLGTALAGELARRGAPPAAVANRAPEKAETLAKRVGAVSASAPDLLRTADLIVLAVSDDAIADLAAEFSRHGTWRGKIALHTSGSRDSGILAPLREAGASVGSFHPLQSFSGGDRIPSGTVYGIEGDPGAAEAARILAQFLDGRPLLLTAENKPLYHAAACMAANYLVTLLDLAQSMMTSAGLPEEEAIPALLPLVEGVLDNVRRNGTAKALTGPIARGDLRTVDSHIAVLKKQNPEILPIYLALARETLDLAYKTGLAEEKRNALFQVIESSDSHPVHEPSDL